MKRLRCRLLVFWHCRVRGLCVVCGNSAPRRGDAYGVCDVCMGVRYDSLGAYFEVEGATYPLENRKVLA